MFDVVHLNINNNGHLHMDVMLYPLPLHDTYHIL
jgi:hypothetical protein